MAKGGKVQALTDAVNSLERELVKTKTQLEIKEGSLSEDKKRVDAAKKAVKDVSDLPSTEVLIRRSSRRVSNRSALRLPRRPPRSQSSRRRTTPVLPSWPRPRNYCRPSLLVSRQTTPTTRTLEDTWVNSPRPRRG
jgi:hypothetical protein